MVPKVKALGWDDSLKEVKERGCLKDKSPDIFSQHFFTVYFNFLLLSFKPVSLSFVHPTHLLSIYYMIVTLLNPEDTVMNKVNRVSGLTESTVYGGERHRKNISYMERYKFLRSSGSLRQTVLKYLRKLEDFSQVRDSYRYNYIDIDFNKCSLNDKVNSHFGHCFKFLS